MDASSKELLRELLIKAEHNGDKETVQKILQIAKTEGVVFSKSHYVKINLKINVSSLWNATRDEVESALNSCLRFTPELAKHNVSVDVTDCEVKLVW